MSWPALGWASKQKPGKIADKLILIALADRHNEEEDAAWPSVAWLVDFTGADRKTVIASLGRLEALNLIHDTGRRVGKTKQIKVFKLALDGQERTVPKTEHLEGKSPKKGIPKTGPLRGKGPVVPVKESQKRDTEPFKEPIRKRKNTKKEKLELPAWLPRDAWQGWIDMRTANRKKPTERAKQLAIAKLDKMRGNGQDVASVLDQSTVAGWSDLYPVKNAQPPPASHAAYMDRKYGT